MKIIVLHFNKIIMPILTPRYLLLSITTAFLFSCAQSFDKNIKSQFYSVPVDSTLTLNKDIVIKKNTARTFFQNGDIIKEKNLNIYYPHCSITVNTIHKQDKTISPTNFMIYKVEDQEEHAQRFVLFASIKHLSHADGPSIIGQASYYHLKSDDEPDVRTLECVIWGDPFDVKYISISEINSTLGKYFTLNINQTD